MLKKSLWTPGIVGRGLIKLVGVVTDAASSVRAGGNVVSPNFFILKPKQMTSVVSKYQILIQRSRLRVYVYH